MNICFKSKCLFVIVRSFILIFLFVHQSSSAQFNSSELGSWTMFFNQTRLHSKWSLHSEVQFRSYQIKPDQEQALIRGGVNYHLKPAVMFTAGYAYVGTFRKEDELSDAPGMEENRIWEQLLLKHSTGIVFFEHRYRYEQRWIRSGGIKNYRNRARYLFRITVPLNKKEITKNTVFLTANDEIFLNLNGLSADRNRFYAAVGYQFTSAFSMQAGYLLQTIAITTKQYIQMGITYNPDLRKKE